jgi:very-short-patch-repair endonuclease/transposase
MTKCENCEKEYLDISTHKRYCDNLYHYKSDVIDMYNNGLSIKKISEKLKISKSRVMSFMEGRTRTKSESRILSSKINPRKHTEEAKSKIRKKRLEWMKNNPEKTAWRLYNFSYPEKIMFDKFLEIGFDKKYLIVREKSFFPYFIDFAFENEKVALEIDGSQHLLPDRKNSDDKKDKLLIENGWMVIRVSEQEVKNNIDNVINILEYHLNNKNNEYISEVKRIGIIKESKKYIKKERNEKGLTEKQIKSILNQRRVERPTMDVLQKEIDELGFEGVGRKYGVSGSSIKKWIRTYNKLNF